MDLIMNSFIKAILIFLTERNSFTDNLININVGLGDCHFIKSSSIVNNHITHIDFLHFNFFKNFVNLIKEEEVTAVKNYITLVSHYYKFGIGLFIDLNDYKTMFIITIINCKSFVGEGD